MQSFNRFRDDLLYVIWDAQANLWQWSLHELAEEAGLSPGTVYRLHDGKTKEPRLHTIFKLATAVGMSVKMIEAVKRKGRRAAA